MNALCTAPSRPVRNPTTRGETCRCVDESFAPTRALRAVWTNPWTTPTRCPPPCPHSRASRPQAPQDQPPVILTGQHRTSLRRGCLHRPFKTTSAPHSNRSQHRPRAGSGVDPNSWTPDPLGRRYPPCRDQDRRTRRSSGARWLSWCEPDGVRKSCHESLSRRRRRSATGSCKASVTRGVAGMGQAPRSERSCVAFAERIVGCAKNEISWQKPRPGLLGGPYRGGLPVHESESGRVSNRHDGPSARSLPERVLRVAYT